MTRRHRFNGAAPEGAEKHNGVLTGGIGVFTLQRGRAGRRGKTPGYFARLSKCRSFNGAAPEGAEKLLDAYRIRLSGARFNGAAPEGAEKPGGATPDRNRPRG